MQMITKLSAAKHKIFTLLIIVFLALSSCTGLQAEQFPNVSTSVLAPTTGASDQEEITIPDLTGNTVPPVESPPDPHQDPLNHQKIKIADRCLQIELSQLPDLPGHLMLSGSKLKQQFPPTIGTIENSYILDLSIGNRISLGMTTNEIVSPNQTLVAYYGLDLKSTIITDISGITIDRIEIPDYIPAMWLDDRNLVLNSEYQMESNHTINTYSLDQHEIIPWVNNLPEGNFDNPYWNVTSGMVINPQKTHIVFSIFSSERPGIYLWQMGSGQLDFYLYGYFRDTPRWSPDGQGFVVDAPIRSNDGKFINYDDGFPYEGGKELLLVNKMGEISRLTYLTTSEIVDIHGYNWSPDGKSIVFYLYQPYYSENYFIPDLMVLDIETGDMINFCQVSPLPAKADGTPIILPTPVWSPEGNFIAITQINESWEYVVYIIDIETGFAWETASNVSAVGWMVDQR